MSIVFDDLFFEEGDIKQHLDFYFDDMGCFRFGDLVKSIYTEYPPESDVVRMYYAQLYADETHGNYNAKILYKRAF